MAAGIDTSPATASAAADAQSIGLDREVDLTTLGDAVFRSFKSDRVFRMTLKERGFEWGAPEISEPELRQYGQIPDDHDLVIDSKGDQVLGKRCERPTGRSVIDDYDSWKFHGINSSIWLCG